MDREGQQTDAGATESLDGDNVVRLPRDWLGPRDELIPFGPSADFKDDSALPSSADDFWGEDSSALQTALEKPMPVAREGFGSRGRAVAVLGGLVAAVLLALALVGGGSGPRKSGHATLATRPAHHTTIATYSALARTLRILEQPRSRHDQHPSKHPGASRPTRTGRSRKPKTTVERVRYASSSSSSGSPASSPSPAAVAPTETTSQASSSNTQPAIGANGALGPGSSPDG